ncbi:MAG: hypothetical protein MUD08_09865 [Cytophagales bacterium]|nr:hypothetical protein [Cytophagales bacterium]
MRTVSLEITSDEDEEFVMSILRALEQKKLIQLSNARLLGLPGGPMSVETANAVLTEAEAGKSFTAEEARKYLRK